MQKQFYIEDNEGFDDVDPGGLIIDTESEEVVDMSISSIEDLIELLDQHHEGSRSYIRIMSYIRDRFTRNEV